MTPEMARTVINSALEHKDLTPFEEALVVLLRDLETKLEAK